MTVSIVIPNYNGEKLLKKNFPRVIEVLQDYALKHKTEIEIVVNDDGSKDSSKEILQEYAKKEREGKVVFTILFNEKNYGFSTTVNRGVAKAKGDIVVLLNSDVIPDKGFLEPLLEHFHDPEVFAVGCMDKSVETEGTVLRGRGVGKWEKGFLQHRKGELDQQNTLWVSGGSGAFRKSMWQKLDGLNEMMNPFYWEDIDLSYRALKAGYKLVFEKQSTVVHEHEEGAIKKSATPKRVRIISYRNQFYFAWVNMTDTSLILSHLLWLPYHVIRAVLNKDMSFIQGFGKALINLPLVKKKREKVQASVKRADKDVVSSFKK